MNNKERKVPTMMTIILITHRQKTTPNPTKDEYIDRKYRVVIRPADEENWATLALESQAADAAGDPVWIKLERGDHMLFGVVMMELAKRAVEWGKRIAVYTADLTEGRVPVIPEKQPLSDYIEQNMKMLPPGFTRQEDRLVIDLGIYKDPFCTV